jgi:hypothetical protein
MVACASIKLDKLLISWLGSGAIYESVMRIIALLVSDATPMPGKNGIRPSADRTRSRTDDRDDKQRGGAPGGLALTMVAVAVVVVAVVVVIAISLPQTRRMQR